jgi:hypothetical protein
MVCTQRDGSKLKPETMFIERRLIYNEHQPTQPLAHEWKSDLASVIPAPGRLGRVDALAPSLFTSAHVPAAC